MARSFIPFLLACVAMVAVLVAHAPGTAVAAPDGAPHCMVDAPVGCAGHAAHACDAGSADCLACVQCGIAAGLPQGLLAPLAAAWGGILVRHRPARPLTAPAHDPPPPRS